MTSAMSASTDPVPLPDRPKRVRFTSSEPSTDNPEASTLVPTSTTSLSTEASDLSDSDSDSDLSTSSEEPSDESSEESDSDEDEDEDEDDASDDDTAMDISSSSTTTPTPTVENVRANRGKKPAFKLSPKDLGPDIRDFLKDFLPQLKAANEELLAQKRAGTLKKLDERPEKEDEAYIEMDLGLGVLEVKDEGAESSESDEEMGEGEGEGDVLGKLLGRGKKDVGIEVVPDTTMSG